MKIINKIFRKFRKKEVSFADLSPERLAVSSLCLDYYKSLPDDQKDHLTHIFQYTTGKQYSNLSLYAAISELTDRELLMIQQIIETRINPTKH